MGENETEFVTVLTTGNPGVLAVAEALLRGRGIEFFMHDAAMMRFWPSYTTDSPQIRVRREDAEAAREALAHIEESPSGKETDEEEDDWEDPRAEGGKEE